ncbi:MAG: ACT domain-containing protein [Pseudomonadota bacterium]
MVGETDLKKLLGSLNARLQDGLYVFVTLRENSIPELLSPRMIFHETEGVTLIVLQSEAEAFNLDYEFPCRMITLEIHSALEAVGFIAHIASKLAEHGMGVNPVAGFYHDHLFIPSGREKDAMEILKRIAEDAN